MRYEGRQYSLSRSQVTTDGQGIGVGVLSANKSLLRSGGQWYLACKSLAFFDKVPMICLGEPPGAELSR
jgi:hypothetical protein